jgi:hypothetical protein
MSGGAKLFLTMFHAELEGSLEDIRSLAAVYEKKFKGGEITNYVYNENEAFLSREIMSLRRFIAYIESVSVDAYKTVDGLVADIENVVKKGVTEFSDPEAMYQIISRKIQKILAYLEERPVEVKRKNSDQAR